MKTPQETNQRILNRLESPDYNKAKTLVKAIVDFYKTSKLIQDKWNLATLPNFEFIDLSE
jgi:hypothetical protein